MLFGQELPSRYFQEKAGRVSDTVLLFLFVQSYQLQAGIGAFKCELPNSSFSNISNFRRYHLQNVSGLNM